MPTPFVYPAIIPQAWALNGSKNTIPTLPDATPGHASLDLGFPPLTMTPIQNGGVPPSGLDFNGIFNLITQHSVWLNGGGMYVFDAALVTATGGYKAGAVIQSNDKLSAYISLVDSNTVDFNTTPASIGVQWAAFAGAASEGNTAITVTTTGGSTTLTTIQAEADIIIVTGVLASASTIVFPPTMREWKLINNTTGAFGMVAKASAGQSLTMTQGFTNVVFYDGAQLVFPDHDSGLDSPEFRGIPTAPTAAPGTNTTQIATTAFARAADAALLINTPLTGIPTAPTAAPLTNNTQVATTAYADAAVSAAITSISAQYVSSNFTASSTGDLWTDTRAAAFTITLPDPPVGRNMLTFRDIFGTWGARNLTINPGTKTILGAAGTLICNASGRTFGMEYDVTNSTWTLL